MKYEEAKKTIELAFGRILRMGSRPTKEGDIQEYERCRNLIIKASKVIERHSSERV